MDILFPVRFQRDAGGNVFRLFDPHFMLDVILLQHLAQAVQFANVGSLGGEGKYNMFLE